ncbi:hypothetical protein [Pseudodesulfovibrio piezophilus]|uniref:Fimbrial assembly family protein n=1 Tax=Pseudodesulfovibrio piezophilus (strain DSM 21447 / JCM 15486 / C1TLV30) TaxID=1322246 RepID=M1WRA2_PSEP2|nr:hypothetical protein [Pseudodesulfovibrio piezophilus]CCH49409.1 conserved protein of unknown function [Pseudodesulfovibrio piezophilus C1TLV30]
MKKQPPVYFWSFWPRESQKRFFRMILLGTIVSVLSISIGLKLFSGSLEQRIAESKEQYGRVVPIVQDIKALRAQQGALTHLSVEDATWAIIDDLVIEKNLTSIRSTVVDDDIKGIQVTFSGLSLNKLTSFMVALRDRASLQTPSCILTRNPDDPRLADAHFVLAR